MLNAALEKLSISNNSLNGQVAIVTGAGRGIGRAVSRALAYFGAAVVVADVSPAGEEAAAEIHAAGGQALFVYTDVSVPIQVENLATAAHRHFGPASILVNNAIVIPYALVQDLSVSDWDRVMAVNLRGAFLLCKTFLPQLHETRGVVVNMISTEAMPGLSAYIASKQGLTGFSQSLALELGSSGIRVVALSPGMVATPGLQSVADGLAPQLGMTRDQFLGVSLHPDYAGLMPVEHAAAATVYLITQAADEYHGGIIDGYSLLEQAGILSTGTQAENSAMSAPNTVPIQPTATDIHDVQELLVEFDAILAATQSEFDQLPIFARPMAANGFRRKSGQPLALWQQQVARLRTTYAVLTADQQRQKITSDLPANRLERLVQYYRDVPAETARFSRDEAFLNQVRLTSAQRVGLIQRLQKFSSP